ncbi:glycoside hydrolase family 18 protein [Streptomyces sp. TRM 70351]|uniref:chitinase n=1 Tax=Streptomyces sp. TRM 70351 TaxID=3116552 RepID=UPI002E7BA185|nr:glycoside hydrolase family 18 protein [Streptomyces sp. TRM 70351]MEE1927812.1 glycoside hydrolase family 18 protein [Streptomyces sp. TRM 70351]
MERPFPTGSRSRRLLGGALAGVLTAGALAVGGIATAGSATAAEPNLVANPGFESGLSGWTCSGGSGRAVSSPVRSGSAALTATPAGSDQARCSQTVTVRPGSDYQLSAWVQGSYVYLGAQGTGTTDVSTWTPGGSGWQQLTTRFRTGPSTTSVTVYTHGWYGQSGYTADDLSLTGPGEPPEEPETPAVPSGLAVGGTTSGSVTLNWSAVPDATTYHVYQDGTRVQSVPGTSATVTGLAASTAYAFRVSAANSGGESPRSAPVTATTRPRDDGGPGTPDNGVPRHAVTGYWQNFDNGARVQKLREVQDAYDIIAVAFADSTATKGEIVFNLDPAVGYASEADFKADIAAKQAAGKSVIISVGGEIGNVIVNDSASATRFANSTWALMQEYGFDGVDIDLEHGINSTYLTQALRSLSAKAGDGLVVTMAPQTLDMQNTSSEYFKLALNIKDILTVVNTQYYNSGSMLGCDGKVYSQGTVDFLTALACIQLEGGLDASQVGLGVPASTRGAGSGYVSPSVVTAALDCLTRGTRCGSFKPSRTYPDLRGAMTWSTNWDATANNAWSSVVGPHVHNLP